MSNALDGISVSTDEILFARGVPASILDELLTYADVYSLDDAVQFDINTAQTIVECKVSAPVARLLIELLTNHPDVGVFQLF